MGVVVSVEIQGLADEQAADFARLQNAVIEQEQAGEMAGEMGGDMGPDPAAEWAVLPATFGGILAIAMPELAEVYTPEACAAWGAAMVPVAEKYGWSSLQVGPEIGALIASLPFVLGTVAAVKARRAAAEKAAAAAGSVKAAAVAEKPQAGPGVVAGTVQFAAVPA